MSFREDLADYFERLRIRYVLSRTLGCRMGEDNAPAFVYDPVVIPQGHTRPARFVAMEIARRAEIRRAVYELCDRISASPDRRRTR